MFVNLNKKFEDGLSTEKEYFSRKSFHPAPVQQYRIRSSIYGGGESDGVNANSDNDYLCYRPRRLSGGTLSPSQCKLQPAGLKFFDSKNQVNVINLQLNDVRTRATADGLKLSQRHSNVVKSRTRATQTLFRESSAQTLPYLPGISNDPAELDSLEIFKLPAILTGNGPPGLYEVEVLERARKRWRFAKALKENFRKQLEAAKEQVKLQKHDCILEAFEWEHWIEREENIQECQMLRLELLIRMFNKREHDMHVASKLRIQKSYQDIEAKKIAALKKNEIEYNRDIRRLNIKHKKQPRVWRKESISQELGDPSSEFYAPQIRYGANPNRRHYTASRGFELRMNDLEKKTILMDPKNLKCPFSKLQQWSKPKQILQEVEQNFCSDANLTRLYDSLRTLRESSKKYKYTPLCLKAKNSRKTHQIEESQQAAELQTLSDTSKSKMLVQVPELPTRISEDKLEHSQFELSEFFEELRQEKQTERLNMEKLQKEMRCEELEALISSYQGNTIGWLMRFLTEEMCRLKEQRKLQLLAMLAKRKRWRREAAEAGLRQKENCVRETYEKIYEDCNEINKEATQTFLDSVLNTDLKDYAHQKAEEDIVALAKDLDKEISGWLNSLDEVQTPLNYQTLRQALKDIVMPDEEKVLNRLERDECIDYIINDVLLNKVYHDLEPYDISYSLVSDLVDRLIDNDIFLNSPDCSSDCECMPPCTCSRAQQEAKAIIRKVLRRAVPGRRWLTEEERITVETIRDLLDDIFNKVIKENGIIEADMKSQPRTSCRGAYTDLICYDKDLNIEDFFESPPTAACKEGVKLKFFNSEYKICADDITKSLICNEKLLLTDPDKLPRDDYVLKTDEYVLPEARPKLSVVYNIPSYHDLPSIKMYRKTPIFAQTSSEELLEGISSEEEIKEETSLINEGSVEEQRLIEQLEEQTSVYYSQQQEQAPQEAEINKNYSEEPFEEEPNVLFSPEQTDHFSDTAKESIQKSLKPQTVQILVSDKPVVEENIEAEANQEEDDSSGFMTVSFTYDPQLKFSVAIPTNEEDLETDN